MSEKTLRVLSLYPRDMNIYGDRGNVLALTRRIREHGYTPLVHELNPGEDFPAEVDIVLGGGGQDSGQVRVAQDLQRHAAKLRELADAGTPMLVICGLYQLFGHEFRTQAGEVLPGIGILDATTKGGDTRMIGNIVLECEDFGEVIGYENHSGNTVLGAGSRPLGKVRVGAGNNPTDGTEGARTANVIGTYLHGSLLPKNPAISDFLIRIAAEKRFGEFVPVAGVSETVEHARRSAASRPR